MNVDGQDLIGALVFWNELRSTRVSRVLWRAQIESIGLGGALGELPKPERLLARACDQATNRNRGGRGAQPNKGRTKLKSKTPDEVVYAIMMRRDVGGMMREIEEARAKLKRDGTERTPRIEINVSAPPDPKREELIEAIVDGYVEHCAYCDVGEISETLVAAVRDEMLGITVRNGVYFVPSEHVETAKRLAHTLETTTNATLSIWEQRASEQNRKESRREAKTSITTQLDEVISEMNTFIAETPAEDVSSRSMSVRVRRYKALQAKVELYADILGDYRHELLGRIADAKQKMINLYVGEPIEE